jgi:hypothetical protein
MVQFTFEEIWSNENTKLKMIIQNHKQAGNHKHEFFFYIPQIQVQADTIGYGTSQVQNT